MYIYAQTDVNSVCKAIKISSSALEDADLTAESVLNADILRSKYVTDAWVTEAKY